MKNYLISVILLYSVCAFAQKLEDMDQKAKTSWDIYYNNVQAMHIGRQTLKDLTNSPFLLALQDFELKSIARDGFKDTIRICTFESTSLVWEIKYCGPSGSPADDVEGGWQKAMGGTITFKNDPTKKQLHYYFVWDGSPDINGDENIYFIPNYVSSRSIIPRNILPGSLAFEFEDKKVNMLKFAHPSLIQAVISTLLTTSPRFIEESFSSE